MIGSVKLFSLSRLTKAEATSKIGRNSAGKCSRGRDPKMGHLGAETCVQKRPVSRYTRLTPTTWKFQEGR